MRYQVKSPSGCLTGLLETDAVSFANRESVNILEAITREILSKSLLIEIACQFYTGN